jgi:hypothetical protein
MTHVKVKNSTLMRDTSSMGLSNIDKTARNEYQSKLNVIRIQKQEINNVKEEIQHMKSDMVEIKSLLNKLLEK